jgi:hypothetical protein
VQQQFGICEHYAGHLEFLNVLLSASNEATRMSSKAATRLDGALAAVAYTVKNHSEHIETLNVRSHEQSLIGCFTGCVVTFCAFRNHLYIKKH